MVTPTFLTYVGKGTVLSFRAMSILVVVTKNTGTRLLFSLSWCILYQAFLIGPLPMLHFEVHYLSYHMAKFWLIPTTKPELLIIEQSLASFWTIFVCFISEGASVGN